VAKSPDEKAGADANRMLFLQRLISETREENLNHGEKISKRSVMKIPQKRPVDSDHAGIVSREEFLADFKAKHGDLRDEEKRRGMADARLELERRMDVYNVQAKNLQGATAAIKEVPSASPSRRVQQRKSAKPSPPGRASFANPTTLDMLSV
jgi:hypothetical protein